MGNGNKYFVEFMDQLYVIYGKITPGDLMKKQYTMQAAYQVEETIEIISNQIDMGQEFTIAGNSPFSD